MKKRQARGNGKPSQSKAATARILEPNQSLTIADFCRLEQFSRRFFYNLERQGKAPLTYWAGAIRRITPQAHARWRSQREAEAEASQAA